MIVGERVAGLGGGVRWVLEQGVEAIRAHQEALTQQLFAGLGNIPDVTVYSGLDATRQTATVSFNIAGMEPAETGLRLDEKHGIMCRVRSHCAPAAHKTPGTFPTGTVRLGLSAFNTPKEISVAITAVRELAQEAR